MISKRLRQKIQLFALPLGVIIGIILYFVLFYQLHLPTLATLVILGTIVIGSFDLLKATIVSIVKRQFALDYIALLAITVGVFSHEYIVAGVIVLMLSGGQTLEKYGMLMAKKSLTALANRIPNTVLLFENGKLGNEIKIEEVIVGQELYVRKGEVIPLDGILVTKHALTDESSLTGEPYFMDKQDGDPIRSGTVNVGDPIVVSITKAEKDSTYRKIVEMVTRAQEDKAPLIRLADRYSVFFTFVTLSIAAFAYVISGSIDRVLAVLVIATPCPLILATPIALMGGMNLSAKKRIILKQLSSLEVLSRVKAIIFDKTGTITLGSPVITSIDIKKKNYTEHEILSIARAIERSSLHPLAKAIIDHAKISKAAEYHATDIAEVVGIGITGSVRGKRYELSKAKDDEGMVIEIHEGSHLVARLHFEDEVKTHATRIFEKLKKMGIHLSIFTGDKKEATERILAKAGIVVEVKTDCSPEDKLTGISALKKKGYVTAMVGDGINDAPALAKADVGMVFSHEEQTAASEAADIVFLGGDITQVVEALQISHRTIHIALESIIFGIGVSILGMICASLGYIPPLVGSILQEVIDVAVILNALRASRVA